MADILVQCGLRHLPLVNGKRKCVWKDKVLGDLCSQSSVARADWIKAGRPSNGPLYTEKCRLRREVRRRVTESVRWYGREEEELEEG